ncbi:hypothetical protein K4F52_007811 [Lecanicillium sp. MT-2017a]|nr:hypothetical protein K4F52_007811 [Lecanicillium sp. MT-2017a]
MAQAIIPSGLTVYNRCVRRMVNKEKNSVYRDYIRQDVQKLETKGDSALLWLGNREKATKVVYFLHGGAFFLPLSSAHVRMCWDIFVKRYADAGVNVACAMLQYTLSPRSKYPNHLKEAVAGFEEIRRQGFSARDIFIGGDSAGANLTTQLLLHIYDSHPEVPQVVLDTPLKAAFLISPYLTRYAESMESRNKNRNFDMVPSGKIEALMPIVVHDDEVEEYHCGKESLLTPLDTPRICLEGFERVVEKLNITIGEYEAIADHGRDFANLIRRQAPLVDTQLVVGEREPHDAAVFEYMTFRPNVAAGRLKAFMDTVILDGEGK